MAEFVHEMFGTIRATEIDGEAWFLLTDVAKALGYNHGPHAKKHLRDSQFNVAERDIASDLGFSGGKLPVLITESGFYRLALKSEAKNAEAFQDWVTDEVLPSLRSKGSYSMQEDDAPAWARELMSKVEILAEKAAERDLHLETSQGYSLADVARMVGLAPREFNEEMVASGMLVRAESGHLVVTPGFKGLGLFATRKGPTTLVTPEGLDALQKRFTADK